MRSAGLSMMRVRMRMPLPHYAQRNIQTTWLQDGIVGHRGTFNNSSADMLGLLNAHAEGSSDAGAVEGHTIARAASACSSAQAITFGRRAGSAAASSCVFRVA
jgi:hypothetical protein